MNIQLSEDAQIVAAKIRELEIEKRTLTEILLRMVRRAAGEDVKGAVKIGEGGKEAIVENDKASK